MRRLAAGALLIALATGCGASPQHDRSSKKPARGQQISFTGVAESARAQWYDAVERAPGAHDPLTLSEADVERATQTGAAAVRATVVASHYVALLGGTADVVVQPDDPVSFAEQAGQKVTTLLGPLGRDGRAYLVTVVDSARARCSCSAGLPVSVADSAKVSGGKRRASARARSSASSTAVATGESASPSRMRPNGWGD
jgi:hypothetical protein